MNKQQYQEYLRSDHWRDIREDKLIEAGYKCQKCHNDVAGVMLEVHHLTYDRVGHERMSDLQVLCSLCHQKIHIQGFVPKKTLSDKEIDERMRAIEEEVYQQMLKDGTISPKFIRPGDESKMP